jgi:hypothetical protein
LRREMVRHYELVFTLISHGICPYCEFVRELGSSRCPNVQSLLLVLYFSAIHVDDLAGDEVCVRRGEEEDCADEILRLFIAFERNAT